MMGHKKDMGGTFTDTANYVDSVAECTNLSVGYSSEHSTKESLDTTYLIELKNALLDLNWKNLNESRKPGEVEYEYDDYYGEYAGMYGKGKHSSVWIDEDQEPRSHSRDGYGSLLQIIKDNPMEIADFLEEYGVTPQELSEAVYVRGGYLRGPRSR
jgi:hypothetical protein